MRARGEFDVHLVPQPPEDKTEGSALGRMSIDKQYRGDLVAAGKGEMLTATTAIPGSAGYVAIEHVTGRLGDHTGSFVLQHSGTLNRGKPRLNIRIVPDSGTGELTGVAGTMTVEVTGGKHLYEIDYTLPGSSDPD
jgi:hypothetical protein